MMNKIKDILSKVLEALKPFKTAIIILLAALFFMIILGVIVPAIQKATSSKEPIIGIEATNDNKYKSSQELSLDDFSIVAKHKDGKKTQLSSEDVTISNTSLAPIGDTTNVTLYLKENPEISCDVEVKIKREKVIGFQCGYPIVTDVIAVLYSNGELCFEGEGDVLVFGQGNYPWLNYDESDSFPIYAISFQKGVTPSNMNYWFEGLETLTYVEPIPSSVRTMVGTFEGCSSLTATADWSNTTSLLNINNTYKNCESLKETFPIPERVRTAQETFSGCSSLQFTADTSNSKSLVSTKYMYRDCNMLISAKIGESVTDMTGMFENCINLKLMPTIPPTVEIMDDAFVGNISLTSMTEIPISVKSMNSCFANCEMLTGELVINANALEFGGMFDNAAIATKVNLIGGSALLDAYGNTSTSGNVLVNGRTPNSSIHSYEDVFGDK